MSKETNKLIPDLRFPEFVNDSQWENIELGEISEIVRGGSPRPIQDYTTTNSDGLNWLKIADVPSDSKYITNTKEKVIRDALNSTREVNPGDLILSNSMSFGRPYILKIKTCIHDGWIAIRKISNKTFEDYLYYFISSESCQSYFQTNAAGAAVKNLNAEIIKLLPIYLPKDKNEQQKIASCLSSLDEVIAAHSQRLDLLKDHKKGLMQNMFPQEGEKVPKLRFKEFVNDGEWVEKKLGELIELKGRIGYRGYTLEDIVGKGEGAISMSPSNINEFGTLSFTKSTYITWAKYEESPEIMLQNGFTVLVKTGSTFGKVAYISNLSEKATINPQLVVLKPKKVDSYFLYLLVSNTIIQKQINETVVGGAIPTLSQESISKFEILVPKNKEQEKIAECLTSLDALITAQAEKVEQLKLHKKGLMQGLFPKTNE